MDTEVLQNTTQVLSGHGWSWAWLPLVLGVAVMLLWQAYRWLVTPVPGYARFFLVALRFAWVGLLLWCLWDPQREERTTTRQGQFPDVMVAVDASQSMAMPTATRASAWPSVLSATQEVGRAIPLELRERTQWFKLGASLQPWSAETPPAPQEEQSRVLEHLREAVRGTPRASSKLALFVMSDGQDTTATAQEVSAVAADLQRQGVSVYPLMPQDPPQPVQFVRLRSVEVPSSVVANAVFPLRVRWSCVLRSPASYDLELSDAATGQVLTTKELKLDGSAQGQESFNLRAQNPGLLEIRSRLIPKDGKAPTPGPSGAIAVVKREETRVLLVQGSLDWEFRFVRKAISENPSVMMDCLLRMSDTHFMLQREGEEAVATRGDALQVLQGMATRYDVVILANTNPALINEATQSELLRLVRDHGGGILFFTGNAAQSAPFRSSVMEQLLPVVLEEYTERLQAEDSFSRHFRNNVYNGNMRQNERTFVRQHEQREGKKMFEGLLAMRLTPEGKVSDIWKDASGGAAPTPPATFMNAALANKAKPAASVLAVHPKEVNAAGEPRPVLAVQRIGAGRSAFLGVDALWRWRMETAADAREYDRFWQQLLLWLGHGASGNTLAVNQFQFRPGDEAKLNFNLRLTGGDLGKRGGVPAPAVLPTMQVTAPTGEQETLPLQWDRQTGKGSAAFTLPEVGSYRFELKSGGRLVAANSVNADTMELEREFSGMNLPLLRGLAEATGGKLLQPAELKLIPDLLAGTRQTVTEASRTSLWRLNWVFLLILGLYLAELAVRRKFLLT